MESSKEGQTAASNNSEFDSTQRALRIALTHRLMRINSVAPSGQMFFHTQFDMVRQFHMGAAGIGASYIGSLKTPPPLSVLLSRYEILKEEFSETGGIENLGKLARGETECTLENLTTLLDWICDMNYFLLGLAVNCGLPYDSAFLLVHNANMQKLLTLDGPIFREDGKVLKPEGWVAPETEIWKVIQNQHAIDTKQDTHEHKE